MHIHLVGKAGFKEQAVYLVYFRIRMVEKRLKVYFSLSNGYEELGIGPPYVYALSLGYLLRHVKKAPCMHHVLPVDGLLMVCNVNITLGVSILEPFLVFPVFPAMHGVTIFIVIKDTFRGHVLWYGT